MSWYGILRSEKFSRNFVFNTMHLPHYSSNFIRTFSGWFEWSESIFRIRAWARVKKRQIVFRAFFELSKYSISRIGWDQLIIWSTNETQELKGLGCFWHTSWEKVTFLLSNLYFGCSAVPTVKGGKGGKRATQNYECKSSIYWNRLDWCR